MGFVMDADAVASFRRDGFVAIEGLVQEPEIARLRSMLMDLHERNAGFEEGAQFDAAAPDDESETRRFPQILNPHHFEPRLLATGYHQVGLQIARQLLGATARFRCAVSFLKPAHIGSDTPWHQDEAFDNPTFDHQEITIWLALTEADIAHSCMSFIPGSHLYPVLEHRPMDGDPRLHALECVDTRFDPTQAIARPLAAGGCTIHTQRTLHYAGPNTSADYRLAYALLFDLPPIIRREQREFPWQQQQQTGREARHQQWRRRGGVLIHFWRQRHRVGFKRGIVGLQTLLNRVMRKFGRS